MGSVLSIALAQLMTLSSTADIYGFFFHAIPDEGVLSLEDLHHVVRDIWLTRFDDELEAEKSSRRKGRPKSAKEVKLEEMKLREADIYRTGMGALVFLFVGGIRPILKGYLQRSSTLPILQP